MVGEKALEAGVKTQRNLQNIIIFIFRIFRDSVNLRQEIITLA
jgi:hypothetical protein